MVFVFIVIKMMEKNNIILYSTGCPNCRSLETLLRNKKIDFVVEEKTIDEMIDMGFSNTPMLKVDKEFLAFYEAIRKIQTNSLL